MIGNNRYIAHKLSLKEDSPSNDIHEIEMIMNEYWRYIKYLQKYSDKTSIRLPRLGTFDFQYGKGKKAREHFTKQLELVRAQPSYKEGNLKALAFEKIYQDQLDACIKQIATLEEIYALRTARWLKRKEEKALLSNNSDTNEEINNAKE